MAAIWMTSQAPSGATITKITNIIETHFAAMIIPSFKMDAYCIDAMPKSLGPSIPCFKLQLVIGLW